MGAHIEGAGTHKIRIRGVSRLHGAEHSIIPDRIEAGTFLTAAAITGGELVVERCNPEHLTAVLAKLTEAGVQVARDTGDGSSGGQTLTVKAGGKLRALDVNTQEYPGFPTDMQAQYMTLMTQAEGSAVITETIF
jgi:UDP-N-acetylglucosamine 1-carboxyvinyltransferase